MLDPLVAALLTATCESSDYFSACLLSYSCVSFFFFWHIGKVVSSFLPPCPPLPPCQPERDLGSKKAPGTSSSMTFPFFYQILRTGRWVVAAQPWEQCFLIDAVLSEDQFLYILLCFRCIHGHCNIHLLYLPCELWLAWPYAFIKNRGKSNPLWHWLQLFKLPHCHLHEQEAALNHLFKRITVPCYTCYRTVLNFVGLITTCDNSTK